MLKGVKLSNKLVLNQETLRILTAGGSSNCMFVTETCTLTPACDTNLPTRPPVGVIFMRL